MCSTIDDKVMHQLFLQAIGVTVSDGLQGQLEAIARLRYLLKIKQNEVGDALRVQTAHDTAEQRIKKGDQAWGVHMRHCYGLNYDDHFGPPGTKPTERYQCKYGENDICPAALYEDPWAVYVAWEDENKTG